MTSSNTAGNAYTTAANTGRVLAYFQAIIPVLIVLILGSIGIYLLFHPSAETQTLNASVSSVNSGCQAVNTNNQSTTSNTSSTITTYNCPLTVSYQFGGKTYSNPLNTTGTSSPYKNGDTIVIEIDPNNPNDLKVVGISNTILGLVFIAVSVVLLGIIAVWLYLVTKVKAVAAVSGVANVSSILFHH